MTSPLRRARHPWLVPLSIAAHLAVGVGMFASGIWRLDRLESDHRLAGIAVLSPPAPSGSPADLPAQKLRPKRPKKIARDPVQPTRPPVVPQVETSSAATDAPGNGGGTGQGSGDRSDGDPAATGACVAPPCGAAPTMAPEPPRPPAPRTVDPRVLQHLRIAGETQIHPPDVTKTQMLRDGRARSVAMLKVCVSPTGATSSVSVLRSSKYPAYDDRLLAAVQRWRYRPHTIDGVAVAVCGMVSFDYAIK